MKQYTGRHRAPRSHDRVFRRVVVSALSAVALSAATVAVPQAASATDTTPTVQLVMSHVRFVSVVAPPGVTDGTDTLFDLAVVAQQPYDNARDDGAETGSRVPLTRKYPSHTFSDPNFDHAAQFSYSTNSFQWSTELSAAWQSRATGPVTETTYWYVNGGKAYGSGHVQHAGYTFHGSFTLRPGDTVDMANEFVFECGPNTTCNGTLYSSYYVVS